MCAGVALIDEVHKTTVVKQSNMRQMNNLPLGIEWSYAMPSHILEKISFRT
ncbi:hypothetical protein MTR67_043250 [Solanum verrucosum]|uniref:Uncharacterized protein n=1 Tax=Solanum verrucosum TaxID=315347 RepID=A0AAF0ZUI4_SOLVR|nr:hypothetical protein MTR67_043250 [Solanum verrucosum]